MWDLIVMGGKMWTVPILLLGGAAIALAGVAFARLETAGPDRTRRRASLITHIGLFSLVWGVLGQALGLYQAMTAIQAAGDVSPAIVLGGVKVSMIAPLMGLSVFAIALLLRITLSFMAEKA